MPTHGGEDFAGEGWGGLKAWNDDVGVMMRWLAFYILLQKEFSESLGGTHMTFLLCFALRFLLYSFPFCTDITFDFLHIFLWKMKQAKEKFWQAWKSFSRKNFLALSENLGASWELLHQTFALDEKIGGFGKSLRQTFALDKILGGCGKLVRQTFAPHQNLDGSEKLLRWIFALYKN